MQIAVTLDGATKIYESVNARNEGFHELHVGPLELTAFKDKRGEIVETFIPKNKDFGGDINKNGIKTKHFIVRTDMVTYHNGENLHSDCVVILAYPDRPYFYGQYMQKGYSDYDLCNLDGYLAALIGDMLHDFARINRSVWSFPDKNGNLIPDAKKTKQKILETAKAFAEYNDWAYEVGEERYKHFKKFKKHFKFFRKYFESLWV